MKIKCKTNASISTALTIINELNKTATLTGVVIGVDKNQDTILEIETLDTKPVIDNGRGVYFCPNCKGSVWQEPHVSKYCFRCGTKLNWDNV